MNTKVIGVAGETIAKNYLKNNGYKVLGENFSNKIGEIDLIAEKNKVLIFIEVKTRNSKKFGMPSESVNIYKQQKIRKVALSYIKKFKKFDIQSRFDVIEILNEKINHIENAFWLDKNTRNKNANNKR